MKIKFNTIQNNILIFVLLLLLSTNSQANWLDIVKEATSQLVDELFSEKDESSVVLSSERLNLYPAHYKLQQIVEPIHNTNLFFLETGVQNKPPLLLIHGLGDLATIDWLNVIPNLEKNYHVYAIDLPGFGSSSHNYFIYSPKEYSRIINWFIQKVITPSTQKPILIGHSMGAAVSLFYASHYPESIERLVLVSAAGILERTSYLKHLSESSIGKSEKNDTWLGFNRRLNHFTAKWVEQTGKAYDPTKILSGNRILRKLILKDNSNLNAGLALMDTNFSLLNFDYLPPTIMIWGVDDPIAPFRTGRALQGLIPRSTLIPITNAGHVPMKSKSAEFNHALRIGLTTTINEHDNIYQELISQRIGKCKDDDNTKFKGHYAIIILENCKKAQLQNVVSKSFFSNHSIVTINNSRIGKLGYTNKIYSSRIEATSSQFLGSISLKNSKLDFANVKITANTSAIQITDSNTLIFSLSKIDSSLFKGNIHGFYHLNEGNIEEHL
ncbi:MAG: hypothetical protein COB38_07505 [Gammaproteobacteria bacterium]|nr:MAG: hypothetical protein COB38_07505 [Gammaproteobacteria bacterium]